MITIWKFPITTNEYQSIEMPAGARILDVQMQFDQPAIWALVNSITPKEARLIRVFGTGQLLPNIALTYIGSFQMAGRSFVWHVFEAES